MTMTDSTQLRDALIQRHMPMAEAEARYFSAGHSNTDPDDARSIAYLALVNAIESYDENNSNSLRLHCKRLIEDALAAEFRKGVRRQKLAPTCQMQVLGTCDGDPLNSIRDLRSAWSLNPHADISRGMADAIAEVCMSVMVQCCAEHPEHDVEEYGRSVARDRVVMMRERFAAGKARRIDRAPVEVAA